MDRHRTILVTGAAGFIGSHLIEALLARGQRVVGLDNFDAFYDPRIKHANLVDALGNPGFELVVGDVRDDEDLARVSDLGPFGGIVHLAARAGVRPSLLEPALYDSVNVVGTTKLLELARRQEPASFVFGSSSSVYGATSRVPFQEDDVCDRPSSPYASTKRASEMACHVYHHLYDLDVTCLRFFTVYGPRQRPEMAIHKFTRLIDEGAPVEIYGDGTSRRDYTFVSDVVDGILRALDRCDGYKIFNLGTTDTTPVTRLVHMIGERLGRAPEVVYRPVQPGDVPETYADITRAVDELSYTVTTRLDDGLDQFVAWYEKTARAVAAA